MDNFLVRKPSASSFVKAGSGAPGAVGKVLGALPAQNNSAPNNKTRSATLSPGSIKQRNSGWKKTMGKDENPITNSDARQKSFAVQSVATGHQRGGGPSGSTWQKSRNAKLRSQQPNAENDLLRGVVGYISGPTGSQVSNLRLIELVTMHGGKIVYMPNASVTHTITMTGLSGSKTQKRIDGKRPPKSKLVTPSWILDSIALGKRQPEARYAVDKDLTQASAYASFAEEGAAPPKQLATSRFETLADIPAFDQARQSKVGLAPALPMPLTPSKLRAQKKKQAEEKALKLIEREENDLAGQVGEGSFVRDENGFVVATSSPLIVEEAPQRKNEPAAAKEEDEAMEETEEEEDDDDEVDEWGMPPSAQKCSLVL